jgi:AcrR family transcriptional regulator
MPATAATPSRARRPAPARLSAEDWIEAGFRLIAEEGLRAVKIDRLSAALGVTKGSFYWHFADIAAYMEAVSAAWTADQRRARAELVSLRALPPEERLSAMMRHLAGPRQWMLERAAREWARWDPNVAARSSCRPRGVRRGRAGLPRRGLRSLRGAGAGARLLRRRDRVHPPEQPRPARP